MGIQLQDTKTQKIILVSILGAALIYVYFLTTLVPFTYKASAAEIKELSDQYKGMSSDITKARQTLNSLPYLEKEYNLLHAKWEKAQALLPNEEESASVLRTVALLGDQSGVEFVLFKPLSPQPAQFYTEHPVQVKVEGSYNEVGAFLSELANMERIVTVSGLEIESVKGAQSDKSASASFVATTYTLGGTGVPPEEVAKSAPGDGGKGTPAAKVAAKERPEAETGGGSSDE